MKRLTGQQRRCFSEKTKVLVMVAVIVAVTGLPYLQKGLSGYFPDLMYHMLRIEGVKNALAEGIFPVRIYENFFHGYGYGSPLFYPDIFLLFPAFLRMLDIPPLVVWKIFALCLTVAATLTTWWSVKYISKDSELSMAATFLIMLSQFYLADLCYRVGISEYLAFVFIPLLLAGIYDFFVYEGKKVYLIGLALAGLVLSHTIMTFIGLIITSAIFIRMMFVRKSRNFLFDKRRMAGLITTALCTVLIVAYYIFPMIEQMMSDYFQYMTPWAYVGEYAEPFYTFFRMTGYFSTIAYVGIGIPILALAAVCIFLKKPQNKWTAVFFWGGIVLFVIQTPVFPWQKLNDTVFNMIQFPYRLFPYALLFLVVGITMILAENLQAANAQCTNARDVITRKTVIIIVVVAAVATGMIQNLTIESSEESTWISADFLGYSNDYVGVGEWLPEGISPEVTGMTAENRVLVDGESRDWYDAGAYYYFRADGDGDYIAPLMYYKGYQAELHSSGGAVTPLPVQKSDQAMVMVRNRTGQSGEVRVRYGGTAVQKISSVISLGAFVVILMIAVVRIAAARREERRKRERKRARLRERRRNRTESE